MEETLTKKEVVGNLDRVKEETKKGELLGSVEHLSCKDALLGILEALPPTQTRVHCQYCRYVPVPSGQDERG